jgi:RNA polymerase sigma-70 factor (ECF subfamily)
LLRCARNDGGKLRRLGRREAARDVYLAATAATKLEPLRRLYARRLAELDSGP